MVNIKKTFGIFQLTLIILLTIPVNCVKGDESINVIELTSKTDSQGVYFHSASINGKKINEYDYVWNVDTKEEHTEIENCPAEYFTGTKSDEDIYIAHDVRYYPLLDEDKFIKSSYEGKRAWLYYYEVDEYKDYLFSLLPYESSAIPTRMMHSKQEAYENAVLHINKAGTYKLKGNWHGQINIDLNEDSYDNPDARVTLILDNVDIECTVSSGILFENVFEVDNAWMNRDIQQTEISLFNAGANIVIADNSVNKVAGTNVSEMFSPVYKEDSYDGEIRPQETIRRTEGALQSNMSMAIYGETNNDGMLYIESTYEGLDSELHLEINGGHLRICADDDGINASKDDLSIITINNGTIEIIGGLGEGGDGIDSNGYININGGEIIVVANSIVDSGLDSMKTTINGGKVIGLGSQYDLIENGNQNTMNVVFSKTKDIHKPLIITNENDELLFAFDLKENEFFSDLEREYKCAVVSSPVLTEGNYHLYIGGYVDGKEKNGIYQSGIYGEAGRLAYTGIGSYGFEHMDDEEFNRPEEENPSLNLYNIKFRLLSKSTFKLNEDSNIYPGTYVVNDAVMTITSKMKKAALFIGTAGLASISLVVIIVKKKKH